MSTEFTDFDSSSSSEDLLNQVKACSWGKYFDGIRTLDSVTVQELTSENPAILDEIEASDEDFGKDILVQKAVNTYKLRELNSDVDTKKKKSKKKTIYTDPEVTRIKRQRANLHHKIILHLLHEYLKKMGAEALENEHIDLFAKLPSNDKYIFEVKSVNRNNLLSQTRKGISQLYEYRFRYKQDVGYDTKLCLVFPSEPNNIPWLQDYVCNDRSISIIWFNDEEELEYSSHCEESISPLLEA